MAAAFAEDQNFFEKEEYMQYVGKSLPLDKFMTRTMVSLYAGKISTLYGEIDRTRKAVDDGEGHDGPPSKRHRSEEYYALGQPETDSGNLKSLQWRA